MKVRIPKLRAGLLGLAVASGFALTSASWGQITSVDAVDSYEAVFQGTAQFTAASDRPHAGSGNYAYEGFATGDGARAQGSEFLAAINAAASGNVLTFSFWTKHNSPASNSAFWLAAASAGNGNRNAQAHVPNGTTIYFDTAGCCGGDTTRISTGVAGAPGWTDNTWYESWHHWVFMKSGDYKVIWIDGVEFHSGTNTAAFFTDNTALNIGMDSTDGNAFLGMIDDFAVFGSALSATDVAALFGGTAPDQVAGASLVAYWPFDDPPYWNPVAGSPVGFSIGANDVGSVVMDPSTATLQLDGVDVTPTSSTKQGTLTTVEYVLPDPPFEAGSTHEVSASISDTGGATYTTTQSFVVGLFTTIPADLLLPDGEVGPRGFKSRSWQLDGLAEGFVSPGNGVRVAEEMLAGELGDNVALEWGAGTDGFWVIGEGSISHFSPYLNLHTDTTSGGGNFLTPDFPDEAFPGIPGSLGLDTDFSTETYAAIEFPAAGLYEIGVNSDDAFSLTAGTNPKDLLNSVLVSTAEGNGEVRALIYVEAPGKYGFRLVHQNGGGAGQLEWFTVDSDGNLTLVNHESGLAAYQWVAVPTSAYVRSVSPAIDATDAAPNLVQAVIIDGPTPVNPDSVSLQIDGADVEETVEKDGDKTTVSYVPDPIFDAASSHTALLTYTDGGEVKTLEWSFVVAPYTKDTVGSYVGVLEGVASFLADMDRPGAAEGNYAIDMGEDAGDGRVFVADASFVNAASANNVLALSIWQRNYATVSSSTFWIFSPTSTDGERAFQAHIPWSNGQIYFDTAGCCDGATQRINLAVNADNWPAYTGAEWWNDWHHYYFVKDGDNKQIWIDGELFHEGVNTGVLPTDIYQLQFGANAGGAEVRAVFDEAALFDTALSTNAVQELAAGTAPDAISESSALIAYWPFDDPPVSGAPTIALDGEGNIVFTGVLQMATEANGTYEDVDGATSPYPVDTSVGSAFYRSRSE